MIGRGLAVALALAGLAACGDLPRPFAHQGPVRDPLLAPRAAMGVDVAPVIDAPAGAGDVFAELAAQTLRGADVPAATGLGEGAGYRLSSRAFEAMRRGVGEPVTVVVWRLEARSGEVLGEGTIELPEGWTPWTSGRPEAFAPPARRLALDAAALVRPGSAPAEPPVSAAGPRIHIEGIDGAPGHGNRDLTLALGAYLRAAGATIVATPEDADAVVTGAVKAGPPDDAGQRTLKVVWQVFAADGTPMGEIAQENAVPAPLIAGTWGPLADAVAEGGVVGMADLLAQAVR